MVIKALGLANPQWTPLAEEQTPEWMKLGFTLFEELKKRQPSWTVHEVFPSATYTQLSDSDGPEIRLSLRRFDPGPKDMLDA